MKPVKPLRINGRVPVLSAQEAVNYIPDEATLCVLGAGGGILEATTLITALADKYKQTQTPRNLSIISPTGLGDRADRGISPLAQEGLVKWALCGHWGQSPRISDLAEQNKIIAYNYPQGVLTQTLRAAAAHQPGIISDIGIGTFVDPRQQGGKLNEVTKEDLIKLVEFDNKEYLYYKAIAPDIAFIRATTCDSEGYATFEDEVMYLDALVIAQAVHNNGGIVMMQVQKMVKEATLHPKSVRIPGYLVDIVVVDPDQTQLYGGAPVNRFISGDFTLDDSTKLSLPLNQRKLVARRALFEMRKGAVGNVGVGIADGIGLVAREEGCADDFILTVETGPIGGITSQGIAFGANVNTRAILDMTSQFDFYHGGGLDVCYLSFAEVDQHGNVGVHKFNGKIMGTGGFIDISATSKKIIFCGTFFGQLVDFVIGTCSDHNDQHFGFRIDQLIHYAQPCCPQLDFKQPRQVRAALVAQRLAIAAIIDRDWILLDLFQCFCHQKPLVARQAIKVLLCFREKFYSPVHSSSTSSKSARSASVIPYFW